MEIIKSDKSYFKLCFNYFTYNFWYLFVIWILGLFPVGFIFDYFVVLIKGIILGITFSFFLKSDGIPSVIDIVKIYYQEFILIIPSFLYLSYQAIVFSLGGSNKFNYQNKDEYLNKLYKVIFLVLLASVLYALTKNTIKIS